MHRFRRHEMLSFSRWGYRSNSGFHIGGFVGSFSKDNVNNLSSYARWSYQRWLFS